ncbi:MAG: hypothetical protein IKY02_00085, partial [Lachnospiraceae bacterium]|nr:hypothetical protein [Lachnospiraceae bacterium]
MRSIPNYSLPANASADEMRAMAVKAFRDALSVEWFLTEPATYGIKTGEKATLDPGENLAGIPYTNATTGLLTFLQYYDFETGKLTGFPDPINTMIGNSCASGSSWGWSAVCASTKCLYTYTMTPVNHCLPVGLSVDPNLENYKDYPTDKIIADNGIPALFRAYTLAKPADILVAYVDAATAHARMIAEAPHVEYKADGSIDPENSYIFIQDQHKGQFGPKQAFIFEEDGQTLHYSGHLRQMQTFAALLDKGYIPITTPEFAGIVPYTVPTASAEYEGSVETLRDLSKIFVTSPYRIVAVTVRVLDGEKELLSGKTVLSPQTVKDGTTHRFPLSKEILG